MTWDRFTSTIMPLVFALVLVVVVIAAGLHMEGVYKAELARSDARYSELAHQVQDINHTLNIKGYISAPLAEATSK